ncbi:MAG TPA: hypothetical protein VGR89_17090 [Puia sp.]|nr:hypothetical protein [Puia sp.]
MESVVPATGTGACSTNTLRYAADLSSAIGTAIRVAGDRIELFWQEGKPFLIMTDGAAAGHYPCPALTVPPDAVYTGVRKIVVACDRGDILAGIADHMELLKKLHIVLGASFEFVHIVRDREANVEEIIDEYSAWKSRPRFLPETPFVIQRASPRDGIADYLNAFPADWLMLFPKDHGWIEFHKSQAENIAKLSSIPILRVYE